MTYHTGHRIAKHRALALLTVNARSEAGGKEPASLTEVCVDWTRKEPMACHAEQVPIPRQARTQDVLVREVRRSLYSQDLSICQQNMMERYQKERRHAHKSSYPPLRRASRGGRGIDMLLRQGTVPKACPGVCPGACKACPDLFGACPEGRGVHRQLPCRGVPITHVLGRPNPPPPPTPPPPEHFSEELTTVEQHVQMLIYFLNQWN